jgi:predicted AlkP superfamily phosphohydrolase/phosphomutase
MPKEHPRAIVVGIDSVSMKLLERFAAEGCLPHAAELMARGAALHAMACLPAYTPANWATLATGAWPGTHGAGNWYDFAPGDRPGRRPMSTFDSRAITAETVWEAAERQGLTPLVIAYPGSFPSRLKRGMILAPLPEGLWSWDIAHGQQYQRGMPGHGAAEISLQPAADWPGLPAGSLEAAITVTEAAARRAGAVGAVEDGAGENGRKSKAPGSVTFWLVLPKGLDGFDRALLHDARGAATPVAQMQSGAWSEWIACDFPTEGGTRPASVRFKLLDLSADADRVRLLRSSVYPTTDFTDPADLSPELVQTVGPYFEHAAMAHASDFASYQESVYEEMEYQVDWHVRAAAHLLETRGWSLFYNHWHFPDTVQHHFMSQADPDSPHYDPVHAEAYLAVLRRSCELGDRLLGGLMELAGPDTYVAVVSDHGNASNKHVCHVSRRLRETGLLCRSRQGDDAPIDWANTLAYQHGGFQINVNLRGREAHGSVEPAHYERVVNEIINALYDWRTDDGLRPVAFALRKKDAALVGYWGERTGDVVFIFNAGFAWGNPGGEATVAPAPPGANHGPQVPTAETALSSNLGCWVMTGPGIKPGYRRDMERLGPARLIDFVPTLCHALGIAPPVHCQGAVEHDIFQR